MQPYDTSNSYILFSTAVLSPEWYCGIVKEFESYLALLLWSDEILERLEIVEY